MKTQNKISALLSIIGLVLTSCYSHNWETRNAGTPAVTKPCTLPATVSYSVDIMPIINASCGISGSKGAGCHGGSSSASGYDLTNYAGVASTCNRDSASLIYRDITGLSGNLMPQDAPMLDQCDINKIIRWINQGYPNN